MKIAIDCADLDHDRIDGTRVYIKNILSYLGKIDKEDNFLLFHPKKFNPILTPPFFPNYQELSIPFSFFWTQTRFAWEVFKIQPQVCWLPIQQIPFLRREKTKFVITIHDLAFKIFPQSFPKNDLIKLDFFSKLAIKKADGIIAVSFSTKRDILNFFPKISPQKIKVIYHGVEEIFFQRFSLGEIDKIKNKFQIKNEYILYVGAIQPRKDLISLLKAFEKIKREEKEFQELKLVLVGKPAWKAREILTFLKRDFFQENVILLGQVSFNDLPKIYQGAKVFVFPSLYEGFGLPILEAFAAGVPVILADNSSLKEIGEGASLFFKTGDFFSLSLKLKEILRNNNLKNKLTKKGYEKARKFNWKKTAQETLAFLKEVAQKS